MGELLFMRSVITKKESCAENKYCNDCQRNTDGDNDDCKITAFL